MDASVGPRIDSAPAPAAVPGALFQRARSLTAAELDGVVWLRGLDAEERRAAIGDLKVVRVAPGEILCRVGRPATFWFGVLDGLLKMSNDSALGMPMTFTGMPPGGWFGEGTVIKREAYRYNIQALRKSLVAGLGVETFHWLLDRSIRFNRFITQQLNERLGQFIGAREIDRMSDPDARVARSLGALFHPVLYPGVGKHLHITQQELGYLVGLSRQRVNEALGALEAQGLIRVEYGGVTVLDLEGLRRHVPAPRSRASRARPLAATSAAAGPRSASTGPRA